MTLFRMYQLADFEQMQFQDVKITQKNKLCIRGRIQDIIPDETNSGLHKLNIQQAFVCSPKVGKIVREAKLTTATVYMKNISKVEPLGE